MRDSALELLLQSCRDAARAAPGNLDRPGSTGGSPWRTKLSALVALVVLAAVAVSAGSAKRPAASFTHKTLDAPTAVVPPTGKVAGHGYAYWMQRRWQWAYSLSGPSSTSSPCHPLTANGKQVTFLSVPRSTGSYSCRQPAGRPIYVNLVSVVCDTLVPGEHPRFGTSDAQLQLCSKSYFTGAGTPSATVDGHAVNFKGLLVATGGFPLHAPSGNPFGVPHQASRRQRQTQSQSLPRVNVTEKVRSGTSTQSDSIFGPLKRGRPLVGPSVSVAVFGLLALQGVDVEVVDLPVPLVLRREDERELGRSVFARLDRGLD